MSEPNSVDDGIEHHGDENRNLPVVIPEMAASDPGVNDRVCEDIIHRNVYWAMGAGVIPVMFLDTAALVAVQTKMVKEIAAHYEVPFRSEKLRTVIGALLSSATATAFGAGLLSSGVMRGVVQNIPIFGSVLTLATMPAFYGAFTYATGKVFQKHFASGGTLLTFDPVAMKDYFQAKFEEKRRTA